MQNISYINPLVLFVNRQLRYIFGRTKKRLHYKKATLHQPCPLLRRLTRKNKFKQKRAIYLVKSNAKHIIFNPYKAVGSPLI